MQSVVSDEMLWCAGVSLLLSFALFCLSESFVNESLNVSSPLSGVSAHISALMSDKWVYNPGEGLRAETHDCIISVGGSYF